MLLSPWPFFYRYPIQWAQQFLWAASVCAVPSAANGHPHSQQPLSQEEGGDAETLQAMADQPNTPTKDQTNYLGQDIQSKIIEE